MQMNCFWKCAIHFLKNRACFLFLLWFCIKTEICLLAIVLNLRQNMGWVEDVNCYVAFALLLVLLNLKSKYTAKVLKTFESLQSKLHLGERRGGNRLNDNWKNNRISTNISVRVYKLYSTVDVVRQKLSLLKYA